MREAGTLSISLTSSNATLGSLILIYTGSAISDALLTDLNGDGVLDVVACDTGTNQLIVLPGTGNGTFASPLITPLSSPPRQVVAADFNGDHHPDILVRTNPDAAITIYTGAGAFQLAPISTMPLSAQPYRAIAGDLDGDGNIDVVLPCFSPAGYQVLFGRGDGTFEPQVPIASSAAIESDTVIADLDGDGRPEIVSCEFSLNTVTVVRNLGGRAFASPVSIDVRAGMPMSNPGTLAVLDANDDGRPDIVALLANNGARPTGAFSLLVNNGDATFAKPLFFESAGLYVSTVMTAADFTGDGRTDLVTWSAYTLTYYLMLHRNSPFPLASKRRAAHH